MPQCVFIKTDGERCKANAKDGEEYCATHLRMLAEVEPGEPEGNSAPSEEGAGEVTPAIHSKKPRPIRFTSPKGTYDIPSCGVSFRKQGQIEVVPYEIWQHLLETQPDVFEEV